MNKQNVTIYGLISALVIVLVGAGLALNPPSEADITNESKAEMFNFMAKTYVNQKDLKADLDEIRDEFKEAMSHPHMEFDSIAKKLKQLDGAVSQLYTEEQTTSSSEWDIMLDADFNTSTGYYEVERGELINLSAELPSNAQTKVEIEGPFNYDREWTTSVASSGKLNSFFQMENTATLGVYELTIKQNNKSDSIEFEIIS